MVRKSWGSPIVWFLGGETMIYQTYSKKISITKILFLALAILVVLGLILSTGSVDTAQAKEKAGFVAEVVSSAPDQVSGGDARLHITVPKVTPLQQVEILVNGEDQAENFIQIPETQILTGVIDGLVLGENTVIVKQHGNGEGLPDQAHLTLTNYPITGPIFSGPHQHPFICSVQRHDLGQPIVDNEDFGTTVFDGEGNPIGLSKDCSVETLVTFVYKSTDGNFKPYTPGGERPADMAHTTTMDGLTVDYIVRWERGTINRFIYSLAMLAPFDSDSDDLDTSAWNGKLIYHFQGGVAIGHDQGDPSGSRMLYDYGLSNGYAIAYSTGTKSGTHYNLVLGGETALMVKERFIELYDIPIYTVGVGGSGGGIQQYIYGQNHHGLIDAAIPQYSYPDMVTQAVHVGDCELLEFYMDVVDGANPRWQTWSNRTLLEGMNASDTVPNPYTGGQPGNTECINGWRGLSPLALNPNYGYVTGQELYQPYSMVEEIEWSHFGDLVNVYGVADDGYARNFWDNVGVQYGLSAVASGQITPAEFLQLNFVIGGWKNEPDMVQEGSPFYPPGVIDMSNWDPWSYRNQVFSTDPFSPAPRVEGNLTAMQAAYESGLVFRGDIDIPIIDWRNYLESELNMHNSHQSFASRQRIRDFKGNSDNQVIWFTDIGPYGPEFDQTPEAFEVIDEWMSNILANPAGGVAGNKPSRAVDRCFDKDGNEIAAGDHVWDGILDNDPAGTCTSLFPVYGTSRIVAGGPFKGSIFKCHLKPVAQAISDGDYGVWTPNPIEQAQLMAIFPDGVCDFSQPDMGLPPGW